MAQVLWPGWETIGLIGKGGFGSVYEIRRTMFEETEKAALKVIRIPQNSSEIDELFGDGYTRESISQVYARHLKSIVGEYTMMRKMSDCANIVSCDDIRYVQHSDGIGWDIFIKMELLNPILKAFPRTFSEQLVVKAGKDLCNALVTCRQYAVLHRDIKPQNIFVTDKGEFKLGDFGVAKTVEQTMSGTKIGTYKYMAPEVYNNEPYGVAADIYSLGLVLYWMLNDRRLPFLPMPPAVPSFQEEEQAKLRRFRGEPLPPPRRGGPALQAIVLKACAFDPADRFESAAQMLEALEALTPQDLYPAPNPTPAVSPVFPKSETKPTKSLSRRWVMAAITLVLVGSILLGILFIKNWGKPAAAQPETTVLPTGSQPPDVQEPATELVDIYLRTREESTYPTIIYEYDSNGYLLSQARVDFDGTELGKKTYRYDSNGNLISTDTQDQDGSRTEYRYDSSGKLTEKIHFYIEGTYRYTYQYDNRGNLTQEIHYKGNTEDSRWEREYDQNNNLLTDRHIYNGAEQFREEFRYDDNGNLITRTYFSKNVAEWQESYQYNSRNQPVEKVKVSNSGAELSRYEYFYNSNGELVKEVELESGVETHRCEYTYDSNGNLLSDAQYYNGLESTRWDYQYDDNGNLIRQDSNDSRVCISTYQLYQVPKETAERLQKLYAEHYLDFLINVVQ